MAEKGIFADAECSSWCSRIGNNPPSHPPSPPPLMKIAKYVFFLSQANENASKRCRISRVTPVALFVLYTIQVHPRADRPALRRHIDRIGYRVKWHTISCAIEECRTKGLIDLQDHVHTLTPLGREFLSIVRHFLLNKRI